MKAVERQIQETGQVGGSNEYPPVEGCNCGRRGAKELFRRPCPFHAVPEPVSTEGAAEYADGVCDSIRPGRRNIQVHGCIRPKGHKGRPHTNGQNVSWFPPAAPIAPAAVSDTLRKLANEVRGWLDLEPVRLAGILGNTNVAVMRDRLALADSELAKPSAEGDGWIAVTERLPKVRDRVLAVDGREGDVEVFLYVQRGFIRSPGGCTANVTRWRPLPAPPSGARRETMIHARDDYNRIQDPDNKIAADEPVFLVRAQDALSSQVVDKWANLAERAGASPEIVEKARRHSQLIRERQRTHSCKVPDLPSGATHE